jgi:prepilin-type N-terminal cleavage/methylation domain-containing protein
MMQLLHRAGFTLIEMIVSLAVFSVVITIAVGALLALIAGNEQLQSQQSIMTNLSFALDSMTREIRSGYYYHCEARPNYAAGGPNNIFTDSADLDGLLGDATADCPDGNDTDWQLQGVSFIEGGNSITGVGADRILYFFDADRGEILRKVGDEAPQSIVSSGIFIKNAEFWVTGSDPQEVGDDEQATVTIFIEAAESNDPSARSFYVQTTVTQRILDL